MFPPKTKSALMMLVVLNQLLSNVLGANTRIPLLVNPRTLQESQYVTVTGCNNDCDIACCYCDITKQPPFCVQCCKGDP
ncbi:hypothetical protein ABFS82_08G004600 [Erythranthe guttata]